MSWLLPGYGQLFPMVWGVYCTGPDDKGGNGWAAEVLFGVFEALQLSLEEV